MSFFDTYREATHVTVATLMGDRVTWTPSGGGGPYVAKALYNAPTATDEFGGTGSRTNPGKWDNENPSFQYQRGDFPGLYELFQNDPNAAEGVTIDRINASGNVTEAKGVFAVTQVIKDFDGDYFTAILQK